MKLTRNNLLKIYSMMFKIRSFETEISRLSKEGKIYGVIYTCIGQEAVAAGVCINLESNDYILTTYRGHGHVIAKGASLKKVMAEIFGKKTGYLKGSGGGMHIIAPEIGIMDSNGVVGGNLIIAIGVALGIKLRNLKRVCLCFFGDGAIDNGMFHESLTMASVFKLPIVYICENNLYSEFTDHRKFQITRTIAERAKAYGIPYKTINGNNCFEVSKESEIAIKNARRGKGPYFIECLTYRLHGHFDGETYSYRSKKEIEYWQRKCPIEFLKNYLIKRGVKFISLEKIESKVKKEIQNAVSFAENS